MKIDTNLDSDIHVGHSDFLFLSGGHHKVFPYFSGKIDPRRGSVAQFVKNTEDRSKFCSETGRLYKMVVFPEKCVAISEKIREPGQFQSFYRRHYAERIEASGARDNVLYPLEPLRNNEEAFYRTDSHYSAIGCCLIVEEILKGICPDMLQSGIDAISAKICQKAGVSGDLGRKFDPPFTEDVSILDGKVVPFQCASNGLKVGSDGICILVSSPESITDQTLLIFGDSFFRQLLPMLAVFYRKIIFCRTRFFHYEFVEAFHPNHIFCGLAERYLSRCQPDANRPHFLSYPLLSGRLLTPEAGFSELWKEFCDQTALIR